MSDLTWFLDATVTYIDNSSGVVGAFYDPDASKDEGLRIVGDEDLLDIVGRDPEVKEFLESLGFVSSGYDVPDNVNDIVWRFSSVFTGSIYVAGRSSESGGLNTNNFDRISAALFGHSIFNDLVSLLGGSVSGSEPVVESYKNLLGSGIYLRELDGAVFDWGRGTNGQNGDNSASNRSSPVSVVGGHSFIAVVGDAEKTRMALKEDGSLWTWGTGGDGYLGNNSISNVSSPVSVVGDHSFSRLANDIHNVETFGALKEDGSLWTWGYGGAGALGNGSTSNVSSPVSVVGNHSFVECAFGYENGGAVDGDGLAYVWGSFNGASSPVAIAGISNAVKISVDEFVMVLLSDGSIVGLGINDSGQLGDNSVSSSTTPVAVVGGHSFVDVFTGNEFTLARKADGTAWSWGAGSLGRTGHNDTSDYSSPVAVAGGRSFEDIVSFQLGGSGLSSGVVWSWGNNGQGQLGDNTTTTRSSPVSWVGLP